MTPPIPDNEKARLEALRRYRVMDTAPERAFDDVTKLASYICGTPMALVTLIDKDRQWFKAKIGLASSETPRDIAFCAHTIHQAKLMIVENAVEDERFRSNPYVTGDPHVRFYAGAPLLTSEGYGLGSLCVLDQKPRQLNSEQIAALEALSRTIVTALELRRVSHDLAEAAENIKTLKGLIPICSYCKAVLNDRGYWESVDRYICEHTDAGFTHGICPKCAERELSGLARKPGAF